MAKRENDLGRDPIGKLLLRLALPSVTAQLVNAQIGRASCRERV